MMEARERNEKETINHAILFFFNNNNNINNNNNVTISEFQMILYVSGIFTLWFLFPFGNGKGFPLHDVLSVSTQQYDNALVPS